MNNLEGDKPDAGALAQASDAPLPASRHTVSREWTRWMLVSILFLFVLGWVYAPVLTSNYGYNDDYFWVKRTAEGFHFRETEAWTSGRPITGWGNAFLFSLAHSINGLKYVRGVSVAGIVVFALTAFFVLRRIGFEEVFAAAASLLMSLTPCFAIYAGWLTTGLDSYASAAALLGGYFVGKAVEEPARRARHFIYGGLLLLVAYASYQPVAAFAVVPLLARMWSGLQMDSRRLRTFALGFGALIGAAVLYFITFKLFVLIFQPGGEAERATLTTDPLAKLRLLSDLFWSGLTGWFRLHSKLAQCISACVVGAVIILGFLIKPRKNFVLQLAALGCALAALVFTTLPMLAIREQLFVYRMQGPLLAVAILAFAIGCERLLRAAKFSPGRNWQAVVFAGLVCAVAWLTRHDLYQKFIAINEHEVTALRQGIADWKEFPEKLAYIVPSQITLPGDDVGEFGDRTAAMPWVAPAMLELIYIETFEKKVSLRTALKKHESFTVEYGPSKNKALPVLDGFALVDGEPTTVHDPYWGNIRTNRNGWCCSDWFGVFDNRRFPSIYHSQLGWLQCSGKGVDDFWFGSQKYGLFWTTPTSYTALMFGDQKKWYLLDPTIRLVSSFYDTERKEWTMTPQIKTSPASPKQ